MNLIGLRSIQRMNWHERYIDGLNVKGICLGGEKRMNDYRDKMCVLDGEFLAKCVGQDFSSRDLTFEVEPNGMTFVRQGDYGVEVHEQGEMTFEDIKHLLPTLKTRGTE